MLLRLLALLLLPCALALLAPAHTVARMVAPPDLPADPGFPVPPGTRAIAVKVPLPLNDFVLPGVRVDVLLTKPKEKASTIVLRGVLILAIEGPEAVPAKPAVVTLAVTPDQAKQLAAATRSGTLRLVVRPPAGR